MANNSYSQQALASEPSFRLRLQNALTKQAFTVLGEAGNTAHHVERVAYAQRVINDSPNVAIQLAPSFVNRPNVLNFETSYSFELGAVISATGDPDIESQVATDWDKLSGIVS